MPDHNLPNTPGPKGQHSSGLQATTSLTHLQPWYVMFAAMIENLGTTIGDTPHLMRWRDQISRTEFDTIGFDSLLQTINRHAGNLLLKYEEGKYVDDGALQVLENIAKDLFKRRMALLKPLHIVIGDELELLGMTVEDCRQLTTFRRMFASANLTPVELKYLLVVIDKRVRGLLTPDDDQIGGSARQDLQDIGKDLIQRLQTHGDTDAVMIGHTLAA